LSVIWYLDMFNDINVQFDGANAYSNVGNFPITDTYRP
jgi:hypothetical protein